MSNGIGQPQMKQMVPELRFSEFDGVWVVKKLGTIAQLTSSKRVYLSDYVDKGIPFYRGKEITELKQNIKPKDILYINEEAFNKFDSKFGSPKKNDILITAVGTLGNVYRVPNNSKFYFKDGNLIWLKKINENPCFLEILIQNNQKLLIKYSIGSTQKALTIVELNKIPLNFPSIKEQKKIANFLTAIDKSITLLKQKKATLEQYKKGLMQKIFNQEIRFRDDDGKGFSDWVEIKLGDIGNTLNGLTGKTKENFGRGKRYIQYTQIFKGSKINIDECGLVEISSNEKQTLLNKGDVLFTTSSETPHEIGISSVIVDDIDEIYLNSFCFGYRQTENTFLPEFSQFFFRSANVRKEIIKLAQGSTRFNMSKKEFIKLKFNVPSIKEQQKIADCLSAIDQSINQLTKQIDQTTQFKKGLLQRMFV